MKKLGAVITAVLLSVGLSACGGGFSDAKAISMCEEEILNQLKDPDSAQFSEQEVTANGSLRVVTGLVNAKNSFGGYVGEEVYMCKFVLTAEGDYSRTQSAEIMSLD